MLSLVRWKSYVGRVLYTECEADANGGWACQKLCTGPSGTPQRMGAAQRRAAPLQRFPVACATALPKKLRIFWFLTL